MKPKSLVAFVLGAFLVASIAQMATPKKPSKSGSCCLPVAATPSKASGKVVAVYYLYDSIRCQSCIQIEALSGEVVKSDFAKEMAAGSAQWKPVNTEEPGHEHYLNDYNILSKSVVVTELKDGKEVRWKNLPKIWELLRDKVALKAYLRDEVAASVRGG